MARIVVLMETDESDRRASRVWGGSLLPPENPNPAPDLHVVSNPSRAELEQLLSDADGLIYFGHGSADALGHPAILDPANVDRAAGTVIAVACNSAAELGPKAVAASTETYIGWIDDVLDVESKNIDKLMCDCLCRLVAGDDSPAEFKQRFTDRANAIQRRHIDHSHADYALLVGAIAMSFKHTLRVITA
jgi:hypothetical protein